MRFGSGMMAVVAVLMMSGCNVADLCRNNLGDKLGSDRESVQACVDGAELVGPSIKKKLGTVPTPEQALIQCQTSCSNRALNGAANDAQSIDDVLKADQKRQRVEKACSDGCVGYFIYQREAQKKPSGKITPNLDSGDMRYPGGGTRMMENHSKI